ncbi:MAG: YbaN family protein [Pseudomonadota bacterium]
MKAVWLFLGLMSMGLGILGVVLPLVPTVPFVLLAAFCFARSSERLHRWLLDHQTFGPLIDDWRRNGAIRPRAKQLATVSIAAVFCLSWALGAGTLVISIQAVVLSLVLIFIWSRPNG